MNHGDPGHGPVDLPQGQHGAPDAHLSIGLQKLDADAGVFRERPLRAMSGHRQRLDLKIFLGACHAGGKTHTGSDARNWL
jgi:hypothetical protein